MMILYIYTKHRNIQMEFINVCIIIYALKA